MPRKIALICFLGALQETVWFASTRVGPLREHTAMFVALMLAAFGICVLAFARLRGAGTRDVWAILSLGLLFRLTVLPAEPYESEDVYRYLWDAHVASAGIDPFMYAPEAPELEHLREPRIYPMINSKPYVTAYPPLSQALFRLPYSLFGAQVVPMKALFSILEFCSLLLVWALLYMLRQPLDRLVLWAWNPFFIFEFSYSGHSDSGMLATALLSLYFLQRNATKLASLSYAGAVLSKLHPALWFPLQLRRVGWKAGAVAIVPAAAVTAIYFTPQTLVRYGRSLRLYFRLFEFNAGIHYLLRFIGRVFYAQAWDKATGPYLGLATICIAALICWRFRLRNTGDLIHAAFWIMTADLCLATTVHPWYIAWAAFALPFFPYAFMFYWTGACFLSYFAYAHRPVYEPAWVLLVEYLPLYALMGWELYKRGPQLERWLRGQKQ